MNLKLDGKNVIITGGSDGIGKETARIMAEEGANVIIFARNIENLNKTKDSIKSNTGKIVDICSVDVKTAKHPLNQPPNSRKKRGKTRSFSIR